MTSLFYFPHFIVQDVIVARLFPNFQGKVIVNQDEKCHNLSLSRPDRKVHMAYEGGTAVVIYTPTSRAAFFTTTRGHVDWKVTFSSWGHQVVLHCRE